MPGIEGFVLPEALQVDEKTRTPFYARFTAGPWENGFGHTIGNALRRVLLTAMEGVAVSSIRIDGVAHEFMSIEGVLEDVTDIVLNIKKLKFEYSGTELPHRIELVADQAGEVTGANIREDGVTTVLNPEQVICTLDKDRPFRMDLEIDRGRGYRPSEKNKRDDQPIGTIPVDCLFSPIERVRYDVQATRVGEHTDHDSLELEVWTDGRIDPVTAVHLSADILREHLLVFSSNNGESLGVAPQNGGLSDEERELVDKLCTSVNDLELSVRAVNCLNSAQIQFLGELVEKSESQMLKYRNFGKKSLQEIRAKLSEMGLSLEMVLSDNVKEELARLLSVQQPVTKTEE